ncbi:MAG: hypothetical protein ACOX4I_07945 [Anaerovoracaceae bacterium]|jgi:hypothetical protein
MTGIEITMYVLSIVMLVICVFSLISTISQVNQYMSGYGLKFSQAWMQIVPSIMSAVGPWIAYAFIFFGIARVIVRLENIKPLENGKAKGQDALAAMLDKSSEKDGSENEAGEAAGETAATEETEKEN